MVNNFNRLKLKQQILLGYLIPIILSIGAAATVFLNVKTVEKHNQLVEDTHLMVDDTKDIALAIADMQRTTRGYLLAKNEESLSVYNQAIDRFKRLSLHLNSLIQDEQQRRNFQKIVELGNRVDTLNRNLINLVNDGKVEQAIQIWRGGEGRELARNFQEEIVNFERREKEILEQRIKVENEALKNLITAVILGAFLSAVLAILTGIWLASRISKTINATASVIASSATEIATTIEQQERTAVQQSTSVNQTTSTMDELSASSRQAAEQAEAAATSARQVAQLVMRLSQQTSQIGDVTDLVRDLANQTNMLALNAAVEAARAGNQGKGFAVVASEIRKLADQSKKSAERINTLVLDIQAITDRSVTAMGEDTNTESIVLAINNIVVNSQQISLNAKQQAIAIQQVVIAMNDINQGAKETASGISQTRIGTQNLNEAALNLKTLV